VGRNGREENLGVLSGRTVGEETKGEKAELLQKNEMRRRILGAQRLGEVGWETKKGKKGAPHFASMKRSLKRRTEKD